MEEEKRKIFLEQLDKKYKKLRGFNTFAGGGLKERYKDCCSRPAHIFLIRSQKSGFGKKKAQGSCFGEKR